MTGRVLVVLAVISGGPVGCAPEYEVKPVEQDPVGDPTGCVDGADVLATPEERPVAVCSASLTQLVPIHESTTLFGTGSYDPQDYSLVAYDWTLLQRPEGSAARLPEGGAVRYGFTPDVAGQYVAQLIVTNDRCVRSEPCLVVVEGVPKQDLWIEMFWQYPGDDMDLHLVQAGAPYTSSGDCFYGNCVGGGPSWGTGGEEDDPFLDLDDIPGTGPENINVENPADGVYRVVVHDYPGSVRTAANDVTVRVYIAGELAYEETKTIIGEDTYTPFAEVRWPEATVTPL